MNRYILWLNLLSQFTFFFYLIWHTKIRSKHTLDFMKHFAFSYNSIIRVYLIISLFWVRTFGEWLLINLCFLVFATHVHYICRFSCINLLHTKPSTWWAWFCNVLFKWKTYPYVNMRFLLEIEILLNSPSHFKSSERCLV